MAYFEVFPYVVPQLNRIEVVIDLACLAMGSGWKKNTRTEGRGGGAEGGFA